MAILQTSSLTKIYRMGEHSLLALVVIPSLRISDLGLVDVDNFEMTSLLKDPA